MKTKASSLKTIVFLSLLIGVLMGIALTYFLFPRVVTEQRLVFNGSRIVDTVFIEKEKLVYRKRKEVMKPNDTVKISNIDSLAVRDSIIIDSAGAVLKRLGAGDDSQSIDSINRNMDSLNSLSHIEIQVETAEIKIAENELVHVSFIKPAGDPAYFFCRDDDHSLDSLLVDNYVPKSDNTEMRTEFWASPIGAVGYRLNKNRLVLFGFYEYEKVYLKYLTDGGLEMKYFENVYVLRCGGEFNTLLLKKKIIKK